MRTFQPLEKERMMSKYEHGVRFNLTESGVASICLNTLCGHSRTKIEQLLDTQLGYPHVNGSPELRRNIAALYPGTTAENVLVTVGAIEANYIACQTLLSPGDGVAVMLPNYLQIWGIAKNLGCRLKTFNLRPERDWALDIESLRAAVDIDTKVIAVCNPNNPTGKILTEAEMDAVVAAASRVGAWILSDEVFLGSEWLTERDSPSFFGRYDKVIAVNSMSKAYGLPGLRIGWAVAPVAIIDGIWDRHDYVAISAATLDGEIAAFALSAEVRPKLLGRGRGLIREGYGVIKAWVDENRSYFSLIPAQATAVAFVKVHVQMSSFDLAERLREEEGVLVVPGEHFGVDGHFRIGSGSPGPLLTGGLERIGAFVRNFNTIKMRCRHGRKCDHHGSRGSRLS
jgi:aspartate/methionine/tyrosine aminotransferase